MKPIFKCDYCNFLGTEEEVREHEKTCERGKNIKNKNCLGCKNREIKNIRQIICKAGNDIPENQIYTNCNLFEEDILPCKLQQNIFGGFGF